MHATSHDWDDFSRRWSGPLNFRLAPGLVSFDFEFPSLDQVIDEIRQDEAARVLTGVKAAQFRGEAILREDFCRLPIEKVMDSPFTLAHFKLSVFDKPGGFLHGFGDNVLARWQGTLQQAGFTWERCYPIIFISGKGCATNYHMDFSHVMAWQVYGVKRFCGLRDPDRWADRDVRLHYQQPSTLARPDDVREEDSLCYDMRPDDKLWNVLLTPHWVEAGDEPAMSVNFSHGGLRHHGQLSPNEQELETFRQTHPDQAPAKLASRY